jgi:hypothetical protein
MLVGDKMETVNRVLKGHPGFLQVATGQAGAVAPGAVFWFVVAEITTGEFLLSPNPCENGG